MNTMFLNQSSTTNVLPKITTRNEAEMNKLRDATLRVERGEANELKSIPKILLLSQKKEGEFKGLVMPTENDEDLLRQEGLT